MYLYLHFQWNPAYRKKKVQQTREQIGTFLRIALIIFVEFPLGPMGVLALCLRKIDGVAPPPLARTQIVGITWSLQEVWAVSPAILAYNKEYGQILIISSIYGSVKALTSILIEGHNKLIQK